MVAILSKELTEWNSLRCNQQRVILIAKIFEIFKLALVGRLGLVLPSQDFVAGPRDDYFNDHLGIAGCRKFRSSTIDRKHSAISEFAVRTIQPDFIPVSCFDDVAG